MKLARTLLSLSVIAAFLSRDSRAASSYCPSIRACYVGCPIPATDGTLVYAAISTTCATRSRQRIVAPNTNELQPAWASFATVAFLCCLMICDRDGWTSLRLLMMLEWVTPITVLTVMIVFLILWQDGPEIDCDTDAGRRDSLTSDDSS